MSALAYSEPYKFSAGLLTLVAHALFFSVLYFGVNWSVQQPQGMEVDLWADLPETDNLLPPVAPPVEAQPAPPQKVEQAKPQEVETPAPPVKAEIDMAEKKKKPEAKIKEAAKQEPKKKPSNVERKRSLAEMEAIGDSADQKDKAQREAKAAQAVAGKAAITSEVDKYVGLIRDKIRQNIVNPPDVAEDAEAVFMVTLGPEGSVLYVKLRKSSGNAAYDDVVERAIWRAKSLPLPQDEAAREQFINPKQLKLIFHPNDPK